MVLKLVIAAAAASGVSMCATEPAQPPAPAEPVYQTGPDGLPIRHSPTTAVETGALPDAAPTPSPDTARADDAN